MPRYIDAEKIKIRVERGINDDGLIFIPMRDVRRSIDRTPTADVVEVVRCGQCVYRTSGKPSCQGRHKDWFCANGVRR